MRTEFRRVNVEGNSSGRNYEMKGRVDVRHNRERGVSRLRFYDVHDDQLEVILEALKLARHELGVESDTQALEMICLQALATAAPAKPSAA
jgi:hypothetical protein